MRKLLFAICVLGLSCSLQAQGKSWANLSKLQAGDKVQVLEMNSTNVTGKFVSVTDASILLDAKGTTQTVLSQDVKSVKLMRNKHRLRNTLLLAGAGAGVGAGIGAAVHKSCPSTQTFCFDIGGRSFPAAIGGTIGLIGGGVIGAFLPSHETVYEVGSR
ncbi:MAG TPA: hypothetical protein VGJ21_18745 [Terracidiphilus sp.]|jgi:hypothetical protein